MLIRCLLCGVLLFVSAARAEPVVLVLGDSLSANYGMAAESGWVSLLQQRLARHRAGYRIVNASISGETTAGGLARIDAALAAHKPAIAIVELGANDGLRGLQLDATRGNLEGIVQACLAARAKVLLVGMRLPPNYGAAYAGRFAAIYPALANKYRIALVPFLLEGLPNSRESFQADNIHPTAAVQPILLENVWNQLQPMLEKRYRVSVPGQAPPAPAATAIQAG